MLHWTRDGLFPDILWFLSLSLSLSLCLSLRVLCLWGYKGTIYSIQWRAPAGRR